MKLDKLINKHYTVIFLIALFLGGIVTFFIVKINLDAIYNENLYQQKEVLSVQIYKIIVLVFLAIALLYFFLMFVLSKRMLQKIKVYFHQTTSKLQLYDVKRNKQLKFLPTDVLEFQKLHTSIEQMVLKIEKDYRLLKEYTENVSHEIQTPLAIIKNKIELLLQDQNLNKEHLLTLAKLHQSTGRLSKLSKNLAVLTKIENNQFVENSEVFLADFIAERLEDFEELISLKEIDLKTSFIGNPKLSINATLAYLLFNNLISNAVRHNIKKGKISIEVTDGKFTITNTGNPLKTSKIELFNRFSKSTDNSESTGLGLSMVKKIISFYGFYIVYKNENDLHTISIIFIHKNKK